MKKQIIYLTLLSLMACKKTPSIEDEITKPKEEVSQKPSLVSCNTPTRNPDTAKIIIIGKWQLERTIFVSMILGKVIYRTYKDYDKEVIHFKEDGMLDFYLKDSLVVTSPYNINKLSETTKYPKDSTIYALRAEKIKGVSFGTLTTYRICDDSLYLPFNSFREDAIPDKIYKKVQ